jgi:translation initiation factor IF-2
MTEIDEKVAPPATPKKLRIVKVAKEFHVSVETLMEFLQEEGFAVQNQMSLVTPEMHAKIEERYQKETDEPSDDVDELDFQTKAEQRREKEQERLSFIQREIQEITDARGISLDEVREQAAKEAEEAKKRADRTRRIAERAKEKEELGRAKREAEKEAEKETAKVEAAKAPDQDDLKKKQKKQKARRLERLLDVPAAAPVFQRVEEAKPPRRKPAKEEAPPVEEVEETPTEVEQPAEGAVEEVTAEAGTDTITEPVVAEGEEQAEVVQEKPVEEVEEAGKKKKKKRDKKRKVSDEDVTAAIRKTMAAMDDKGKPRRRKRSAGDEEVEGEELEEGIIKVSEFISVAELAARMEVEVNEVITKCMSLGLLVSINQRLDMDTIVTVADEFGFDVEQEEMYGQEMIEELDEDDAQSEELEWRPPVVTIMGHVDHGKTSLLDHIRSSNIIAGEIGGITQHIGAYVVDVDGRKVTFLDTPGHEAFTAMRARGAQITDIVVLVVAADDKVMPQTIEAINHARAANVPIIVAINKIDKEGADAELIKKGLSEQNVLVDDWGGGYPSVEISAKKGTNIDHLLELLVLQAEVLELKADPNRMARGVVIESELDKGRGPVATILVQHGTLKVGDPVIAGHISGKVRAMHDERGRQVKSASPSTPVQALGFDDLPLSGDLFHVLKSERVAKDISVKRQQLKREQEFRLAGPLTLDEFSERMRHKELKELKLIVKADVDGSVEALSDALLKLGNEEVSVNVIHKAVGAITETDVLLASASQAVILGFHIRPNAKARDVAASEHIDIRTYEIIYDAINDVRDALEGMLAPEEKEEILGVAEVRELFRIPKVGTIAGSYILSGKISRNDFARIVREGVTIYEGAISSLKRFKDDVKDVASGYECGIGIQDFNDVKVGDTLEAFHIVETKAKLEA